jgi:ElaB/YqjD/DUF883 family membrane-anchored ribosome-binding protein
MRSGAAGADPQANDGMDMTMETSKPKVNEDVEILKQDVLRLRDDVVGIVHSAKSRSKDTVMETGNRIRGMMTDLGGKAAEFGSRAKGQVLEKTGALKDRGYEAVENWRGNIEHRPVTSLLIAFAAGLIFATLITRRRS